MKKKVIYLVLILPILSILSFGQNIKIIYPQSLSIWVKGKKYTIKWQKSGSMNPYVKIRLYQGSKKIKAITDSTPNDGEFEWKVPLDLKEGTYVIRVKTVDNAVSDDSPKFRIIEKEKESIKILFPYKNSVLTTGKRYEIKWQRTGEINPYVKIRLLKDGSKLVGITDKTPNNGSYFWSVPSDIKPGKYQIRVKTVDNKTWDDSEEFKIIKYEKPSIKIISPKYGDVWKMGDAVEIIWNKTGEMDSKVSIYLEQNGKNVFTIISPYPNSGRMNYREVKAPHEGKYRLAVETLDKKVRGVSEPFKIENAQKREKKQDPVIQKLIPNYVFAEGYVDINGRNFGYYPYDYSVIIEEIKSGEKVDNSHIKIIRWDSYGATIYVKNLKEGNYSLYIASKKGDLKSNKLAFSVLPLKPYIEKIIPSSIHPGDEVELYGKNFHSSNEYRVGLKLGGEMSVDIPEIIVWKDNYIKFTTKNLTLKTGKYKVNIFRYKGVAFLNGNPNSNEVDLEVAEKREKKQAPVIKKLSPNYVFEEGYVDIKGWNLGDKDNFSVVMETKSGEKVDDSHSKIIIWDKSAVRIYVKNLKEGNYSLYIASKKGDLKSNKRTLSVLPLKPYIEKIIPSSIHPGDEVELYGKNFHSSNEYHVCLRPEGERFSDVPKIIVWKNNYIKFTTKNLILKAGKYKVRISKHKGFASSNVKTNSNEIDLEVLEKKKPVNFDLKATNCGYEKNVLTKGETTTFTVTPYNEGPSTVKSYRISAWSVRGDGTSNFLIRGKTYYQGEKIENILGAKKGIIEYFNVKINDSPGDYTLFIKVESIEPSSSYDTNSSNNVCRVRYKVISPLVKPKFGMNVNFSLPDLTFSKEKTHFGAKMFRGFLSIGVKNPNYKRAKIPKNKKILIRIENIENVRNERRFIDIILSKDDVEELNKKGEVVYISSQVASLKKIKLTIDPKNSIAEENESNNSLIVERK